MKAGEAKKRFPTARASMAGRLAGTAVQAPPATPTDNNGGPSAAPPASPLKKGASKRLRGLR